jgi:hypothetical protein
MAPEMVVVCRMLSTHKDLARKLNDQERKYDDQFAIVFGAIRKLMAPPATGKRRPIGFITTEKVADE